MIERQYADEALRRRVKPETLNPSEQKPRQSPMTQRR
jgi:hypothetical protein